MMLHTETATTARHKMIHYNNSIVLQTVGHGKHSKYVDLKIKMIHYNIFYTDIVKTNSMTHQHTYNIYFLSHICVNDNLMLFISTMKDT